MGLEAGNREAGTVISLRDAAGWALVVLTCEGDGLGVGLGGELIGRDNELVTTASSYICEFFIV